MDGPEAGKNHRTPRLLVSVRDGDEAAAAIAGGCDILDVKEPSRGSLGMASLAEIEAIVATRNRLAPHVPVSVALGEAIEAPPVPGPRSPVPLLPAGIAFAKLGTAGLASRTRWEDSLAEARRRWICRFPGEESTASLQWIAVAYADWSVAEAPAPAAVLQAAAEAGWHGLLIDTCLKDERRLWDWISSDELRRLAADCRRAGLRLALAGRLREEDCPRLWEIASDIVGVRTAACRDGNRAGRIDAAALRRLRACWSPALEFGLRPARS